MPGAPTPMTLTDPVRVVTDTGEMRWFAPGKLPIDVLTWFSRNGGRGAVEERCDTYRVDSRADAGLKMRSGELLELKARESLGDTVVALTPSLVGCVEHWRRWSPADGLVELDGTDQWVEVAKTIVRRRFLAGGVEVAVRRELPMVDFCDVELVAVGAAGASWWSLALTSYGPPEARADLIQVAWNAVVSNGPHPEALDAELGDPLGYPAWLATSLPATAGSEVARVVVAG